MVAELLQLRLGPGRGHGFADVKPGQGVDPIDAAGTIGIERKPLTPAFSINHFGRRPGLNMLGQILFIGVGGKINKTPVCSHQAQMAVIEPQPSPIIDRAQKTGGDGP